MTMGAAQKEIRLIFRTLGVKKSITEIKEVGNAIVRTTHQLKRTGKRGPAALKSISSAVIDTRQRFQMWLLSVLFFGMVVQRAFMGIAKSGLDAFMKLTEGQTSASAAMKRLGVGIEFLKFSIGSAIATALEPLIPIIMNLIMSISDWVDQNPELVAGIIIAGAALGTLLLVIGQVGLGIQGLGTLFGVLKGAALAALPILTTTAFTIGSIAIPVWAVIAAIAILAAIWATNFLGMRDLIESVFGFIVNFITAAFELITLPFRVLASFLIEFMDALFPGFKEGLANMVRGALTWLGNLVDFATYVFDTMSRGLEVLIGWMRSVVEIAGEIGRVAGEIVGGVLGSRQFGGTIPKTGLYMLHRGEKVVPNQQTDVGGINITVNTTGGVNAEELSEIIMDNIRNHANVQSRF